MISKAIKKHIKILEDYNKLVDEYDQAVPPAFMNRSIALSVSYIEDLYALRKEYN